ncbi:hypothetical protein MUN84_12790 [Hymenobacter sp. 5516J-16]|uniref:Secreted protein n=1 Tax=Hymenobacter sublimis TaxID=2933777 RepID=A0ABY4JBB6_9BACT|nr:MULTISPECIES: hypothetical protein [Hymenobacter]UOQ75565.1 hypothetical protein MUN84_12790 [Hymenobacter sp. 5516J-16]UPL49233.1 hypothetical protein MWH26_18900 [Hymenobacter sublimis]
MKTLFKSGLVLALGLLLYSSRAQAQVQINVQVPAWGPAVGPNVQYYYLPEIDGYYDLYTQSYLFFDPVYGAWVSSPVLPRAYAGYDPRFFHPVVVQYVGRQPWGYLRDHRAYCDRWGVQPGRYYGSNWPGHGYVVAPRPNYGPGGYYDNRPYNQGGYARGNYRDSRDYRGNYGGGYDGRYDGRRDDNRSNQNPGGYYGRNDNRGAYDRNGQGSISSPSNPGVQQGSQPSPGGYTGGRGRGRGM